MLYEENIPYWVDIAKSIGPSAIVAVVSYFISRLNLNIKDMEIHGQSRIKDAEIFGQTRLKGKELLFISYQKKIENTGEAIRVQSQAIAENYRSLFNLHDQNMRVAKIKGFLEIYDKHNKAHIEGYKSLFHEIKMSKIFNDTVQSQIDFIAKIFETNIQNLKPSDLENYFHEFTKANALILKLESDLLEQKSIDLFSEYI